MTTKERITEEALTLFAEKGYKGTSVKNIADAAGIKDASLYNHFKSKQEIFDAIVTLISEHISDLSDELGLPDDNGSFDDAAAFYAQLDTAGIKELARKSFVFYLTDPYISKFWRIASMEQYQNERVYDMFRHIFIDSAITYQTMLFDVLMKAGVFEKHDPEAAAVNFYAPIFLLLTRFSNHQEDVDKALNLLDKQVDEFIRIYQRKQS